MKTTSKTQVGLPILAALFVISLSFGQDTRSALLVEAEKILLPCLSLVPSDVGEPLIERFVKAKKNPTAFTKEDGIAFLRECVAALEEVDIAEDDQPKVVRLKAFLARLTKPQDE